MTDDISTPQETIDAAQRTAQSLERERISLQGRIQAANVELADVQQGILSKERSFTPEDAKALPKLRQRRVELTSMLEDLRQLTPAIEQEIKAVVESVAESHRAMAAIEYNTLAQRQAQLTQSMTAALTTFETSMRECLREKRDLAERQVVIQRTRMGLAASVPDPDQLIRLYARDVASVVAGGNVSPDYSAEKMDWTSRVMTPTGELGARL